MPEYLSPGVYIEEIAGIRPIEGVGTSTAGFIGAAERGPESPRLITSWLDFQRWYGGYIPDVSYLAYAVQGFFENGGQRCFVTRVANQADTIVAGAIAAGGGASSLTVSAIGRGAWGNGLLFKVDRANQPPNQPDWFRLTVMYYRPGRLDPVLPAGGPLNMAKGAAPHFVDPTSTAAADVNDTERRNWVPDLLEVFDGLTHEAGRTNSVQRVVNANSRLIRAWWPGTPDRIDSAAAGTEVPEPLSLAAPVADTPITAGDYDGDPDPVTLVAPPAPQVGVGRGFAGLAAVDEIALLIAPDALAGGPGGANLLPVQTALINQCAGLADRFAILSTELGSTNAVNLRPPLDTSYAAIYHPWIRVYDASINADRLIPPAGHVAGVYARTDIERGVHKAPANEVVRGISLADPVEFPVTKGIQDILNPRGVNCIRDFRADRRGIRVWGARTMSSDGEWKYVNVRRLFIYVEESIDEGTQWVVFEPNDEPTWAKVRRSIGNFLTRVWHSGALMGGTAEEAFFVKCDRTTMTQDDIDNGRLICYIGIAPVKPAEFVIFRISQKTAEAPA